MPDPNSEYTPLNQRAAALAFLFLMAALLAAMLYKVSTDTAVHWISDHGEAVWIHTGFPPDLGSTQEGDRLSMYRRQFNVDSIPDSATMTVEVFYDLRVDINDTLVLNFDDNLVHQQGKNTQAVLDIAPFLIPGENTIRIIVNNTLGPQVLRVECPALNLYSDPDWEYGSGPDAWDSAVSAVDPVKVETDLGEQSEGKASFYPIPILVLVFITTLFLTIRAQRSPDPDLSMNPSTFRWFTMAMLLLLGINNLWKLDPNIGMDLSHHSLYLANIVEQFRIPLPSEGLFAFRSPLFYMIAAGPFALFQILFNEDVAAKLIRIVPILMSLAQVEIVFRALQHLYADRPRCIVFGTLIGAFIPINIYIFQFLSDEPAAGITGGLAVLMSIYLLKQNRPLTPRESALAGAILGLAFLAKISTFLLVPPCLLVVLSCHLHAEGDRAKALGKSLLIAIASCFLVSGWYYIRNWIHLGTPIAVGWDQSAYDWWQSPGFRTSAHYMRFGEVLLHPLYSGISSFWDGLYSTLWLDGWNSGMITIPSVWNHPFVHSSAWLGLLPTALLLMGLLVPLPRLLKGNAKPCNFQDRAYLFSTCCIAIYLIAMLYIHLTVPIYSSIKATYLVAILPCLVLTIVRGYVILDQKFGEKFRPVLYATITCWALSAYAAHFALSKVIIPG